VRAELKYVVDNIPQYDPSAIDILAKYSQQTFLEEIRQLAPKLVGEVSKMLNIDLDSEIDLFSSLCSTKKTIAIGKKYFPVAEASARLISNENPKWIWQYSMIVLYDIRCVTNSKHTVTLVGYELPGSPSSRSLSRYDDKFLQEVRAQHQPALNTTVIMAADNISDIHNKKYKSTYSLIGDGTTPTVAVATTIVAYHNTTLPNLQNLKQHSPGNDKPLGQLLRENPTWHHLTALEKQMLADSMISIILKSTKLVDKCASGNASDSNTQSDTVTVDKKLILLIKNSLCSGHRKQQRKQLVTKTLPIRFMRGATYWTNIRKSRYRQDQKSN